MDKELFAKKLMEVSWLGSNVSEQLADMVLRGETAFDIAEEIECSLLVLKQEPFSCGYDCCGVAVSTLFLSTKDGGMIEVNPTMFG